MGKKSKKYIKDGAYTIAVDVVDESSSKKKKKSKSRHASLDDGDFTPGSGGLGMSPMGGMSPLGLGSPGDSAGNSDEEVEDVQFGVQDDDLSEESEDDSDIDFTDVNYILKNLELSTPDYSDDKTFMLRGRNDLVELICSQVRFYMFLAIHALLNNPHHLVILVIGEGFIGATVIDDLIGCGLSEYLHVYTRGDLTAIEWREKGLKAATTLPKLLHNKKADVVILATENTSFPAVTNQLKANNIVQPSTMVISVVFGLGRRKISNNFGTPCVFRTFVEPQGIVRNYKSTAFKSLMQFANAGGQVATDGVRSNSRAVTPNTKPSTPLRNDGKPLIVGEDAGQRQGPVYAVRPRHRSELSVDLNINPTFGDQSGAMFIAKRANDMRSVLCLLENFYALNDHSFLFSRRLALSSLFGYSDGRPLVEERINQYNPVNNQRHKKNLEEELKEKKKMRSQARLKHKYETILTYLGYTAETYQQHFMSLISSSVLEDLKNEEFRDVQFTTESVDERLHEHDGDLVVHNHDDAVKKVQQRMLRKLKIWHHMYEEGEIAQIFKQDEEYASYSGPGFDCMALWDGKTPVPGLDTDASEAVEDEEGKGDREHEQSKVDQFHRDFFEEEHADAHHTTAIASIAVQQTQPFSTSSPSSSATVLNGHHKG